MVKVIGLTSEEEMKKRQRYNKLFDITRKFIEENKKWKIGLCYSDINSISIMNIEGDSYGKTYAYQYPQHFEISVLLGVNHIMVHSEHYVQNAVELAKAYEESGENEFTVILEPFPASRESDYPGSFSD